MRMLPLVLALVPSLFTAALSAQPAKARAASEDAGNWPAWSCRMSASAAPRPTPQANSKGRRSRFRAADLSAFYSKLPAFCRVVAVAKPTADSDITIEVWMPLAGWNGKLQGLGNGGFAGLIDNFELGAAMGKGYASTATDAGHTGSPIDAAWALGHPEKVADFGHRGIHEMTRVAKALVQQFYGSGPDACLFRGCSDGGREALMEAQRYPADYDGILAGAPANYWTALLSLGAAVTQALTATPASFIPPAKIPAIAQAVIAACDKLDGVARRNSQRSAAMPVRSRNIQCKEGEDTDKCLTPAQVTALKAIYAGLKDSHGQTLFPGYLPGAEEGRRRMGHSGSPGQPRDGA